MLKVLVIDDERPVCRALERLFFDFAQVDAVSDVARAMNLLDDCVYDAILCDLNMPRLSGVDIYRRLADEKSGEETKMIFMTGGLISPQCRSFCRDVDNHVVYKPFEHEELITLIQEVAERTVDVHHGAEC